MTRDWNLIRLILDKLAQKPTARGALHPSEVEGYDAEFVNYQLWLLLAAGLLEGTTHTTGAGVQCVARCLTWEGHELHDKLRSAAVWNRLTETARQKGVELSFEAIKIAASAVVKSLF